MSLEDIKLIETITEEHMGHYGYERMTQGSTLITDSMVTIARQQSERGKKAAWETMKVQDPKDYQLRKFRSDYLAMLHHKFSQVAA